MDLKKLADALQAKRAEIVKTTARYLRAADRAERLTCTSCVGLVVLGEGLATHWLAAQPAILAILPTFMALTYSLHSATQSRRKFRHVLDAQRKLDSTVRKIAVHARFMAEMMAPPAPTASDLEFVVNTSGPLPKFSPQPNTRHVGALKKLDFLHLFGSAKTGGVSNTHSDTDLHTDVPDHPSSSLI